MTQREIHTSSETPCRQCAFIDVQWSQTGCSTWPQQSQRGEGWSLAYWCFLPASQLPPSCQEYSFDFNSDPWRCSVACRPAGQSGPGPGLQRTQVCVVWVETLVEERLAGFLYMCPCVCAEVRQWDNNKTSMHIYVSLYVCGHMQTELQPGSDLFSYPCFPGRHLNYNQFG